MLEQFAHPDSEFRGMAFWAWNGRLDSDELHRQIGIFKQMGFGGFFMHARVGLATEYLGKEWFECIRTCVDEAKKQGLQAWLYDEDRWPSGAAGGTVTRNDTFKMKELRYECVTNARELGKTGNTLALFIAALDLEKHRVSHYRRIRQSDGMELKAGERFLRFYWQNEEKSSWFNGETYLDTMNPDAVHAFIETTHEAYKRSIGEQFGESVPGIFTDEPCFSYASGQALPWTLSMPEAFRQDYACDLLDFLPELFFYTEPLVSHARWAYFNLATKMFVNAFARTIGQWCAENSLALTGHVLGEDKLSSQAAYCGAPMRFYEQMQQPGIDLLTEHWNIFTTVKQCVSVAHQLGRTRRLSESFACTGWDFSLAGHKALGDWQAALGINFLCKHLAWYTMEGEAKRDYPASISYQSSWYGQYHCLEDYYARIGSVISGGDEIRDLLVLHPIESYWATEVRHTENIPSGTLANDHVFEWLSQELLAEKLDFDYGDEELMSRLGSIEQSTLCIGKGRYKAVLIPEIKTIRCTTLKLLKDFSEAGGLVCYLGQPPRYVDAKPNQVVQAIYADCFMSVSDAAFVQALSPVARRISISDESGGQCRSLLYHLSSHQDYTSLFVCNFGKEFADEMMQEKRVCERRQPVPVANVTLRTARHGHVYELDPANGKIYEVDAAYSDGFYRFQTSFAPLETRLFIITEQELPNVEDDRDIPEFQAGFSLPENGWKYRLDEPNALVLDHAAYSVNGRKEEENAFILHIDSRLRKMLHACPRGEAMVQAWCSKSGNSRREALDVSLEYTFKCETIPAPCFLVLERPDIFEIKLNGQLFSLHDAGWWVDKALRKLPLPEHALQIGMNTIELFCRYHEDLPGLENIYLLGNFAVFNDVLCDLPGALSLGDWCRQGFPYFSGNLTYSRELDIPSAKRIFLTISEWRGSALGIRINNSEETVIAWPPEQIELTPFVCQGKKNRLDITVYSSRRNAFGPFYLKNKWPKFTGSGQFSITETADRQSVPCGLFQGAVNMIN